MMSNVFWLTDAPMVRLRPFFPKSQGVLPVDDRRVLSGIIFIDSNGLRWCEAPKAYAPPKTLYSRWKRWAGIGVFARIMEGLAPLSAMHASPAGQRVSDYTGAAALLGGKPASHEH